MRTNGSNDLAPGIDASLPHIAHHRTCSYAPIPSTVRTVCDSRVCVSGGTQQMTDAISASPGRQSVLEGCAFGFEFFHELFRQSPGDERTNCASSGNAPDSSERFGECCQPGPQSISAVHWNLALRQPFVVSVSCSGPKRLVAVHAQESPLARDAVALEGFCVGVHATFPAWSQRCTCETLPCSRHFPHSDFLVNCLGLCSGSKFAGPVFLKTSTVVWHSCQSQSQQHGNR